MSSFVVSQLPWQILIFRDCYSDPATINPKQRSPAPFLKNLFQYTLVEKVRHLTCMLSSPQISEFLSHTISELQASPCHDDHGTVSTAPRTLGKLDSQVFYIPAHLIALLDGQRRLPRQRVEDYCVFSYRWECIFP